MTTVIQFAVLGLGAGAIYALLASGVVAIYRASGVLNLAHGAFAMVGAYLYYTLNALHGWAPVPAAVVATLGVAVLAGLWSMTVMRRLRRSSVLLRVIATVAALLILEAAAVLIWGGDAVQVQPYLPTSSVRVGSVVIGTDRLVILAIAIAVTAALWLVSRLTRIGVAVTAAAENPRAAATLGWSPQLLGTANWVLAGGLAGAAGVLTCPITGLHVDTLALLIVPALAVALLARFESFVLALGAGIALGVAQSLMGEYIHITGMADALPFLLIVVTLFVGGQSLPTRGFVAERLANFGTGRVRPLVVVPAVIVMVVLIQSVMASDLVLATTQSIAYGIVFLSIVLLTGYAGQLSLGQMALAGVGSLIAARIETTTGIPFIIGVVLAVAATAVVSLLFAIPALRSRGATLAVVTLGLGVALTSLVFNQTQLTGGQAGIVPGKISLLGIDISPLLHPKAYALFSLGCFVVCALLVVNIRRGSVGRALVAIRVNERAAVAMGVSVTGAKIYAFAVSAGIAALGGIVLGFQQYSIIFTDLYGSLQSILVIAYTVIGGVGYVGGTLVGSTLPGGGIGEYVLRQIGGDGFARWIPLIGGLGLLLALLQNPNGFASEVNRFLDFLRRRRPPRTPPPLPDAARGRVTPARLTVSDLAVHFGATKAVQGASLTVDPGEIVGLIGPNGAGKTTLIDAVTGYVATTAGTVNLGSHSMNRLRAYRRARAGISRSFQSLELFEDITLRENLLVASDERDWRSYFTSLLPARRRALPPATVAAVREFGLVADLDKLPTELPYGRRRLAAVARAVASEPSVLLLDEPAAGLSSDETAELAKLVRRLADEWGIAVLLVEHDMSFVMGVCDKVVVLNFGQQIASGTPSEVGVDPAVISAYLGTEDDDGEGSGAESAVTQGVEMGRAGA